MTHVGSPALSCRYVPTLAFIFSLSASSVMRTVISLARRTSFGEFAFKLLGVCFALLCLSLEPLLGRAVAAVAAAAATAA